MSHKHSRFAVLVLAVSVLVLAVSSIAAFSVSFSAAQTMPSAAQTMPSAGQTALPAAAPEASHHHAMPTPVNLQVLPKDIKPAELMSLMMQYEGQLGVECEYCHAENPSTHRPNFASDANPQKTTARLMITMTRNINDQYVSKIPGADRQVSCGTCHRGMAVPSNFVPKDEDHPPAQAKPESH